MPAKPTFAFDIKIKIPEAFTLDAIVRSPRTYKPSDVSTAACNNEVVTTAGTPPEAVVKLVTYVVSDFFAFTHGTGLYNRQKHLWSSLSKVTRIYGYQMSTGLMKKTVQPVYDLYFCDFKDKPQVLVRFIDCQLDKPTMALEHLKATVAQAAKSKTLTGIMLCFADKVPDDLISMVIKQIATDPAGRYESIWPGINIPLNLISLERAKTVKATDMAGDQVVIETAFHLVHPNLQRKGTPLPQPVPAPTVTRAISTPQ